MATIVRLPQMGQTMEEATITRWHVKEGDHVDVMDPLFEMLTDKVNMDVESDVAGTVLKILHPEGAVVPVQNSVVILGQPGEDIRVLLQGAGAAAVATEEPQEKAETSLAVEPAAASGMSERVKSSPRARKLAEESGLDFSLLAPAARGPEGRVVAADVMAYLESGGRRRASPLAQRVAAAEGVPLGGLVGTGPAGKIRREDVVRAATPVMEPEPAAAGEASDERMPLAGMRKVIADNVSRSKFTAPHVTLTAEVDMTETVKLRAQVNPDVERRFGVKLSFTEFVARAAALALRDHPWLNAGLEGGTLVKYGGIHLGIAVSLTEGLIVPVVRNADRLSVPDLSRAIKELRNQALANRLPPDSVRGGTFTITNIGAYGIDAFTPILNPPQAAILGVGRVAERAAVVEGQVVPRWLMVLSLSFDHRVVDGVPAALFLADVRSYLESPYRLLV